MESKVSSIDKDLQRRLVVGLLNSIIVGQLPPGQRGALIASLQGMPLQEIASRMRASRSAVFRLNTESRMQIKRYLEQRGLNLDELRAVIEGREERREDILPAY